MVIWLSLILMIAATAVQVGAQSPQGFISIDCGIASNSSYVDQATSISYISDDQYINTGSIGNIDANYKTSSLETQLSSLRSFPTGDRNCYTVPVVQYQRYLVRARFLYGNYDGKNSASEVNPIQFDLHLGTNNWTTMNITDATSSYNPEALTFTEANFLFFCLINTGKGVPFVSALELRPLKDAIYNLSRSDLSLVGRVDAGALTDSWIRYPTDPYDRFWRPYNLETWTKISTNMSVATVGNGFEAPSLVLQTASTPAQGRLSMDFTLYSDSVANQFYGVLCFAEVQVLARNSSRLFDVYRNGDLWSKNHSVPYLESSCTYDTVPFSGYTSYVYSLNATDESTLPPLINAVEIYQVMTPVGVPTELDDVNAMKDIREQYQVQRNWMGDPCSPTHYIWNGLNCAYSRDSSRITSLNLSSSGLSGVISSSFAKLTELTYLDLSNNNLTGTIPDTLGNMPSLQVLILSCNNLTGPVPASLLRRSNEGKIILRFDDGTNACQNSVALSPPSSSKSKISTPVIVVVSVVPAVVLLSVAYIIWRSRRLRDLGSSPFLPSRQEDHSKQKPDHVDHQLHVEMKQFSYNELVSITRNFENVVGEGGFGKVYHGYLPDGGQVAVKMLSQTSEQGTKQFLAEAQNLARIHHRNLVSLVGYCMDGEYLGLVYEYMLQGSLREHLRGNAGHRTLRWVERLRIAVEAAQGLEYLHKGCNPPLIHRDVKTSNILLDRHMEAKLADFGLSKAFHNDRHQINFSTMGIVGTPGYLDPEYQNSMLLNEKSDVYSYGVVLLELVTGQPPIIPGPDNVHIVQRVAQSIGRGYIDDIVDERIRGEYDVNSIWKIVDLSLKCTAPTRGQRPSMSEVVMQLKETLELEQVTGSGTSQSFNTVTYMNPSAR